MAIRIHEAAAPTRPLAELPACLTGACKGGRLPCPTGDACRIAEKVVHQRIATPLVAVGLVLAILSFCAVVAQRLDAEPAHAAQPAALTVAAGASR